MPEEQITKDQHYVPRVYLQAFSQDGYYIYEYNLKKAAPIPLPVTIESVCREKYLYEQRDKSGALSDANYLEHILRDLEGQFAEFRRQLLRKVRKDNFETKCFLTREEKNFWTFYTTLQVMRNPITLTGTSAILQESLLAEYPSSEAYNLALEYCLPFFHEPSPEDLNPFVIFLSMLRTKALSVGFTEQGRLFTSDRALCGSRDPKNPYNAISLWFPITSNCGLFFHDYLAYGLPDRNKLFPLTDPWLHMLNKGIADLASQMVLSKDPFTDEEITLIEEARRERIQDKQQIQE